MSDYLKRDEIPFVVFRYRQDPKTYKDVLIEQVDGILETRTDIDAGNPGLKVRLLRWGQYEDEDYQRYIDYVTMAGAEIRVGGPDDMVAHGFVHDNQDFMHPDYERFHVEKWMCYSNESLKEEHKL